MFDNYSDLVTVSELKQMLKIGSNKAYELLNNGDIKSIKIGTKHRIPKTYIIEYINNLY